MATPLEDRRQIAREAAYDAVSRADPYYQTRAALEAGIEAATRVQITHELNSAYLGAWAEKGHRAGMRAAFEAAGFEVVD